MLRAGRCCSLFPFSDIFGNGAIIGLTGDGDGCLSNSARVLLVGRSLRGVTDLLRFLGILGRKRCAVILDSLETGSE